MGYTGSKAIGFLITSFLCALYCTFPYVGAISMTGVILKFALYMPVCAAACLALYKVFMRVLAKLHCGKAELLLYKRLSGASFFMIVWGILTVAQIPAYLAFFPGIFGYDAPNQMQQILSGMYSSHHPLLHTMVLKFFMECGNALFGTFNGGVALFCIFQGLAVGGSMARSFMVMRGLRTPFPVLLLCLAWCVWNPALQVLAFNVTKDVLFGAVFLHFVINCYEWLTGAWRRTAARTVIFVLTGVLMCLLRNQGIYIVAAMLAAGVLLCRSDRRFLVSLCAVAAGSQLFFFATYHVFGVPKGDAREMLSVPMQQTALVCKLYMEGEAVNLSPEEFEKFSLLVDKAHIPGYHLSTADPIKSYFNTAALAQDLQGYVSLYLTVGAHNVGEYLTAFRCLAYPYWDASEMVARDISISNTFPELSREWGIYQDSLLPGYKEYLCDYILHGMDKETPVFSWLLQPGLCIWMMTALLGMAVAENNAGVLMSSLAGLLFLGTLLLGPVALLRYLYPLMILTPWALALLCGLCARTGEYVESGVREGGSGK